MDIVYSTYTDEPLDTSDILKAFPGTGEITRNGSILSFEYNELQVDLIHSTGVCYGYALDYFSWNDLGNLIGRIAHKFGLKHGHRGLLLPVRDGDNLVSEIVLTTNYSRTLTFLGFDVIDFYKGFNTLNEIFQYVATSENFNPEFYKLENLNTIARTRDRKRVSYNSFLKFIDALDSVKYPEPSPDKSQYLVKIFQAFPAARQQFDDIIKSLMIKKLVKQRFNGCLISEYTALTGKELGMFMRSIKNNPMFSDSFILCMSDETIRKNIIECYTKYKEHNEQ
jgi:hypothetical protein